VNPDTAQMIRDGERRLRDRRAAPQPDPMLELLNQVTADRDRLKRENRALRVVLQQQARLLDRSEPARVVYAEAQGANPS